jgi:hypothetical protein
MFISKYKQLSADSQQVQAAADVLEVTEFRLFEMAYREWFGKSCQEGEMEKLYMMYWFTGMSPLWVRHYSRQVLSLGSAIGHSVSLPAAMTLPSAFQIVTLGCLLMSGLLLLTLL